jgi:hypothetical protein
LAARYGWRIVMTARKCPACREQVSATSLRCSACGVALGEGNRCGRCLAIAPVFERTGRHVCSACGETRVRHDDTLVTTEAALLQAFDPTQGRARPLLLFVSTGVVAAGLLWLAANAVLPRWLSLLGLALLLVAALRGQRLLQRRQAWAHARRRYEIEQRIIGLAFRNDGLLSASTVSTTLRISRSEAQELLGQLASSGRARAESNADGSDTTYFFGEAKRTRGLRGRSSDRQSS